MNGIEQFETEFWAFNYTANEVVEKEYIRLSNDKNRSTQFLSVLSNKKLLMLSEALNNRYIKCLNNSRYSLYDISFRNRNDKKSIGFSFNDIEDYNYLIPEKVFEPFNEFYKETLVETSKRIQSAMFQEIPQFNPIFMIGALIENGKMISVKSYTRLDLDENGTILKRINVIKKISNVISPNDLILNDVFTVSEILEKIGLVFNFIGFDCNLYNQLRYKLYFRNYKDTTISKIASKLNYMLSDFNFNNNLDVLKTHDNLVWGIAISTDNIKQVNGIQLYLYP